MKFLIDAQLPARLAELLNGAGHDAVHTSGLPDGNRSTDSQVALRADTDDRVVVTKDQDFRDGHLLAGSPRQLLIVATGNITNRALLRSSSSTSRQSWLDSGKPTTSSCPITPSRSASARPAGTADASRSAQPVGRVPVRAVQQHTSSAA